MRISIVTSPLSASFASCQLGGPMARKRLFDTPTPSFPRLHAELLLGEAHLADSGRLSDPGGFGKAVADIMLRAL